MSSATTEVSPGTSDLASLGDLVSLAELSPQGLEHVLQVARTIKRNRQDYADLLRGKHLSMIFEKESLRTRFTFDLGMQDLGGSAVFLDLSNVARMGERESVQDMAKNLERWTHGIVARTYRHKTVLDLAEAASVPVINGLSDFLHPCQALADTMTLMERWGAVKGRKLVFVGDGNNTCHSLMTAATKLGMNMVVCGPAGYEPDAEVVAVAQAAAAATGGSLTLSNDLMESAHLADAIYTDVWASMGQEEETEERAAVFADYSVTEDVMDATKDGSVFMHCLPAHRGHEVSRGVIDGPRSIVFDIAENRLHAQKAVLALLLGPADAFDGGLV